VQVCDGTRNKNDVINQTLDEYREVFYRTKQQMQAFVAVSYLCVFRSLLPC
jgi:DNA topoisomerase-3